jgi:hypothetical protein
VTTHEGDIGLREDTLDALPQLWNNLCHTFASLLKGGAVDVAFSGNAAYIQAGATHLILFHDNHLQALLGSKLSGAVTSRPRADDAYVAD